MRPILHLLPLLLLLPVTGARAEAPPESPRVVIQNGLLAIDSALADATPESWARAAAQAEALIENAQMDTDLLWRLHQRAGLALQHLGRRDEALDHLEKAVLWAQTVPENHRNLATLLMAMGRSGRALSEYGEACDLAPGNWEIRVEYGHALLEYGQYGLADRVFNQASALCADCPPVLHAQARLALLREDYAAALPPLERLADLEPSPARLEQLALARLRTGDPQGARVLLLPAWQSRNPYGLRILLEADRALQDPTRALVLAGGVAADTLGAEAWAQAALICIETGEDTAGLSLIDRAVAGDPNNVAYRHNRVLLLRRLGREAEADTEWATVLALDPSRAEN